MHENHIKSLINSTRATSKMFSKVILFLFLSFSTLTFAQPGFDDDVDDETPVTPIDSGIVLLFSAGIILGFYLLKKNQKIKN